MSNLPGTNDVIALEEHICNIQKDISDHQRNLRQNQNELKKLDEKIQTANNILNLNIKNKDYSRQTADVVNLKDYQQIKEKIEEMEDEVAGYSKQLSILLKAKNVLQTSLNISNKSLKECMNKLKNYGKLIQFK
jgi:chromosome segregation ATPase